MDAPTATPEIAFSVEGDFVPMPQAKPNRHGELRIPSDHPVHEQRKRIRQAARDAGAMPVPDEVMEVECVIYGNAAGGKAAPVIGAVMDALEGVAFKEAWQVGRIVTSWQLREQGKAPHFTVLVTRSKKHD
jgi:hypothetical protein